MKVLKFIFVICLGIFCTNINKPEANSTNEKLLYTWIDKVIVREKPTFNSKTTATLRIGERVKFTGKMTKEKYKIELRKTQFNQPFFYVIHANSKKNISGWVYGGTLKVISNDIIKYDNLLYETGKINTLLRKTKEKAKQTKTPKFQYPSGKKTTKFKYYVGTNGCTGDEFDYYYDGGIIHVGEFSQEDYYFSPYSGEIAGVKINMSKKEILKILGKPLKQIPSALAFNAVMYYSDGEKREAYLKIYFKNNKVFAIVHSIFESC